MLQASSSQFRGGTVVLRRTFNNLCFLEKKQHMEMNILTTIQNIFGVAQQASPQANDPLHTSVSNFGSHISKSFACVDA